MTFPSLIERIQNEFPQLGKSVERCVTLLREGAAPPYIARYHQFELGSMRERDIRVLADRLAVLEELERRRRSILRILDATPDLLTSEIKQAIESCPDLQTLEDLFAPLRPKKNEEVNMAVAKGLQIFADWILTKDTETKSIQDRAKEFVDEAKAINKPEEAIEGVKHILIEKFFDDPDLRRKLRLAIRSHGVIVAEPVAGRKESAEKFKTYDGHKEPLQSIPPHRMLALRRAEREKAIKLHIEFAEAKFLQEVEAELFQGIPENENGLQWRNFLKQVLQEAYRRLRERCTADVRLEVKERSDNQAVIMAQKNLRHMLMVAPYGARPILAIDIGVKSAAAVVLDGQGVILNTQFINVGSAEENQNLLTTMQGLLGAHKISAIAVAGSQQARSIFQSIRRFVRNAEIQVDMVYFADSIAETYANSEMGKSELTEQDPATRAAIFTARRLQNPLPELAKLEPRTLGIGQYQQDVGKHRLNKALFDMTQSCVCQIGVDPNTASISLLEKISGMSHELAKALIEDREKNGPFSSRADVRRVPGMDEKTYRWAAPFLRITNSQNQLDSTAVHPEHYAIAEKIQAAANLPLTRLIGNRKALSAVRLEDLVDEKHPLTLFKTVALFMSKGQRDPRGYYRVPQFRKDIQTADDLYKGLEVEGVVSNVTNFGVFVDIGLEQDGLIHISELADKFVRLPHEIARVGQIVRPTVLAVDTQTKRISLTMRLQKSKELQAKVKPRMSRVATARRDGLVMSEKPRKEERQGKSGKGKFGKRKFSAREEHEKFENREPRRERRQEFRESKLRPKPAEKSETVSVAPATKESKPVVTKFVNNPFKTFFTQQKDENGKEQS